LRRNPGLGVAFDEHAHLRHSRDDAGCSRWQVRPAVRSEASRATGAEAATARGAHRGSHCGDRQLGVEPEPVARRTFHTRSFDAVASPREFAKLKRRIEAGKIRVPIAAVYSLARSADAHRHLQ
jgi:zinc-binding alcohol dehydrogenase family protein